MELMKPIGHREPSMLGDSVPGFDAGRVMPRTAPTSNRLDLQYLRLVLPMRSYFWIAVRDIKKVPIIGRSGDYDGESRRRTYEFMLCLCTLLHSRSSHDTFQVKAPVCEWKPGPLTIAGIHSQPMNLNSISGDLQARLYRACQCNALTFII
ncbi:hypothetical protein BC834DRAFT_489759 [Gloeopeniophorella convolvens]|nr:hypothetical protein BC834DRAFT_489759 [Gloeopeniophorella convolvens]